MREILIVLVLLSGALMETRGQHGRCPAATAEARPAAGALGKDSAR